MTPAEARAGMAIAWDADLKCVDRGGFRLVRDSTGLRTFRGGCHSFPAVSARVNVCYNHHPITRQDYLGIRLVADAPIKDRTR